MMRADKGAPTSSIAYALAMRELVVTGDGVVLSFAEAVLRDAGITAVVFDGHIAGVEAGIGAFPRRLMVSEADLMPAARLLRDAGLGPWVTADAVS